MTKRKLQNDFPEEDSEWSSDEKLQLLGALQEQCPKSDKMSFTARGNKVDWQKVDVSGHTAEECQAAWARILAKVRKYRTLEEVVSDARDMVLHPEKYQEKKNRLKHPDQPTKPLTAYFQYVRDHREKMKAKHPDLSNVQLTKLLSQRWQALDPSKQNKYLKRYKRQWKEFQEANAKFLEDHPEFNWKQPKPKQPSPFMLYARAKLPAFREKHPELTTRMVQSRLKQKYTKLNPEKKKKWIQKALAAVPDYEEEVRHYQMHHPEYQPPSKKVRLTREEAALNGDVSESTHFQKGVARSGKAFPGAPVKPPRSAFQMFVKKKIVGMEGSLKEKMVALGQQWQALGTKQRKYFKKCTAQQELYRQQLEEFKQSLTAEELAEFEKSLQQKKAEKKMPTIPA